MVTIPVPSVPTPDPKFAFSAMVVADHSDRDGGNASARWTVGIEGTRIYADGAVGGATPLAAAPLSLRTPDMIGESDWATEDVNWSVSTDQQMMVPTYRNIDDFL